MRFRVFSFVFLVLLLIPVQATPAVGSPETVSLDLSRAQWSRVRNGEVLVYLDRAPGATTGDLTIIGMVDRPVREVWGVLSDPRIVKNVYPRILKGELRGRSGQTEDHFVLVDYPWPLADRWSLNRARRHPALYGYSWSRIDGNIKENRGFWRLFDNDGRTVLFYRVRFDPGLPVIPGWALRLGMKREAPGVVLHLRRHFAQKMTRTVARQGK